MGIDDIEVFLQAEGFVGDLGGFFSRPIGRGIVYEDDAGLGMQPFTETFSDFVGGVAVVHAAQLDDTTGDFGAALFVRLAFEGVENGLCRQTTDLTLFAEYDAGAAFVEHAFIEPDDTDASGLCFDDQGGKRGRINGADENGDRFCGDGLTELFDLLSAAACRVKGGELVTRLPADEHGEAIALEFLHGDAGVRQQQDDFNPFVLGGETGGFENGGRRRGAVLLFDRRLLQFLFKIADLRLYIRICRRSAGGQDEGAKKRGGESSADGHGEGGILAQKAEHAQVCDDHEKHPQAFACTMMGLPQTPRLFCPSTTSQ